MEIRSSAEIGERIRERRMDLNLSQRALAEELGVSRQWVAALEQGSDGAAIGLVLKALLFLGFVMDVRRPGVLGVGGTSPDAVIDLNAVLERTLGRSSDDVL